MNVAQETLYVVRPDVVYAIAVNAQGPVIRYGAAHVELGQDASATQEIFAELEQVARQRFSVSPITLVGHDRSQDAMMRYATH